MINIIIILDFLDSLPIMEKYFWRSKKRNLKKDMALQVLKNSFSTQPNDFNVLIFTKLSIFCGKII